VQARTDLSETLVSRRKFCPVSGAFFEQSSEGWKRLDQIPDWALDHDKMFCRFVEAWQASESSMGFWARFHWLSWRQIDRYKSVVDQELKGRGVAPLKPLDPPDVEPVISVDEIERMISKGSLGRHAHREIAELEDYEAVSAMWNAQPKDYDPLDLQHISVGEAGSLRFRVKR